MNSYVISIDIGTQGTKAALFDSKMQLIADAFEESKLISTKPGTIWQQPDDLYISCVNTIKDLLEKSNVAAKNIEAIGIDGQMAGIMGVDSKGEASTYYDSWLDTRCSKYVQHMYDRAGKRIMELSGGPVTYVHGPKILWWKHQHPDIYKRTVKFIPPHAYVVGKMTGLSGYEAYFDYTHLHFSCLADNSNKSWSDELLQIFDIDKQKMARIVSPFDVIGKVTKDFAGLSGLIEGIPVVAGCGDTAASTFGSGMFQREQILDCAGTASVLCSVVDKYVPDIKNQTLTMMRSPVDGLFLPLAYINGGGMCLRWFRDTLTGNPTAGYDELQQEAEAVEPGSEGLIFIPHFSGRVLPSNPNLKGTYLGLDFKHTRGHMYRAVMESIAYEYKYYLSILRKLYPHCNFNQMLTMGGGAKSELFNRIKADVLGIPVTALELGETALLGSAVIAAFGIGMLSDYKKPILQVMKKGAEYTPDINSHRIYTMYSETYLNAIEKTTPYYNNFHTIAGNFGNTAQ
jgi:xylulokinase